METKILRGRAEALILHLVPTQESPIAHDPTIFDTALVASLYHKTNQTPDDVTPKSQVHGNALFPKSFAYVIERQQPDGGWAKGMKNCEAGRILSTAAALLAIVRRMKLGNQGSEDDCLRDAGYTTRGLNLRALKAAEYLRSHLQNWIPDEARLHPVSARILEWVLQELKNEEVYLHAPGFEQILRKAGPMSQSNHIANANARSCSDTYIEAVPDITLQTQEDVDHATTKEHSRTVGISRSPALTAMHLLVSDSYDEDLETYLQNAIRATDTAGGVPPIFPLSHSETAPVVQLLSEAMSLEPSKVTPEDQSKTPSNDTYGFRQVYRESIDSGETEQTGKVTSNTQGYKEYSQLPLNSVAILGTWPQYRPAERSLDRQCELLKSSVRNAESAGGIDAIKALTELISQMWWEGDWESTICISEFYAFSLFIQSFATIVTSSTLSPFVSEEFLHTRGPIMVLQMIGKLLSTQNSNGTWGEGPGGCLETTSLALLALAETLRLPFVVLLQTDIRYSLEKARDMLLLHVLSGKESAGQKNSLWLRYTAHYCRYLREAHALAAARKLLHLDAPENPPSALSDKNMYKILALASFFHGLPSLSNEPFTLLKIGAIESSFYVKKLKTMRDDIFPRTKAKEMDKYFDYIPIMWTMSSLVKRGFVPPVLIWDISVLSMYIFLVDEYMEGHVAEFSTTELLDLRVGIERIFAPNVALPLQHNSKDGSMSDNVAQALEIFGRWAQYHLTYPSLASASATDHLNLRVESKNYLLHHVTQIADNQRLAAQTTFSVATSFHAPSMGFAPWLHVVGSGHIGAPIGLVWFAACVGHKLRGASRDCFSTVKQQLMIWNTNSHAGKQLRMFNDYGSVVRDAAERNLNSINFPEFFPFSLQEGLRLAEHDDSSASGIESMDWFEVSQRKQVLLDAAMYERDCTDREMEELYEELRAEGVEGRRLASWVEVYYAGGDLFSDMYLLRDVTNSTKDK